MKLEELKVYNLSLEFGAKIWTMVETWDNYSQDTVGKMLVQAADKVAANISTGFGRYNPKETQKYAYFSRGSLYETKTWITKSYERSMISPDDHQLLMSNVDSLAKMLNNYIRSISKPRQDHQPRVESS